MVNVLSKVCYIHCTCIEFIECMNVVLLEWIWNNDISYVACSDKNINNCHTIKAITLHSSEKS